MKGQAIKVKLLKESLHPVGCRLFGVRKGRVWEDLSLLVLCGNLCEFFHRPQIHTCLIGINLAKQDLPLLDRRNKIRAIFWVIQR